MREILFLLITAVIAGLFFGGMRYKEADIVRSCTNYKSFTTTDARYSCNFSHAIE